MRHYRKLLAWLFFLPPGGRHELWPGIIVTVLVCLLNARFQQADLYRRAEWADLDQLLGAVAESSAPRIFLVAINDEDFADPELFAGKSPLLAEVIAKLVASTCRLGAEVVAVDVLTDTWSTEDRQLAHQLIPGTCNVVWARDATPVGSDLLLGAVLGESPPAPPTCAPLPVFDVDDDGVLRSYRAAVLAREQSSAARPELYATVVGALSREAKTRACGVVTTASSATQRIRFTRSERFPALSARVLLDADAKEDRRVMSGLAQAFRTEKPWQSSAAPIGGRAIAT